MIIAAAHSDLLAMMPQQWRDSPWSNELLQVIEVEELLTAPGMHIVKRTRLPLTPAAEYLCDLLRRAKPPEAPPIRVVTPVRDRGKLGRRK
jgi:DNA-binding transcriptional LysR family regulator